MGGTPMHTIFCLHDWCTRNTLILERGAHKPSSTESMAPFHQDPTQRIIALSVNWSPHYLVFRVGALLELLKNREGTEIGWDEWKKYVAFPSIHSNLLESRGVQVSGCRLLHMYFEDPYPRMEVYDFSLRGHAKYSSRGWVADLNDDLSKTSTTGARVRIRLERTVGLGSGHESIIFPHVSATVFYFLLECG